MSSFYFMAEILARRGALRNKPGDDDALPAEMGVAAERACRLQERRSLCVGAIRSVAEPLLPEEVVALLPSRAG